MRTDAMKLLRSLSWIGVALALALFAAAQQQTPKGAQKKEPAAKQEPAPLFGGQLGIKSSRTTKESATLGFNGIDPSGKVDKAMLATAPGSSDEEKVKKMNEDRPSGEQLDAFISQGGLSR